MLSQNLRHEFNRSGLIHLPGAVSKLEVRAMRGRVWTFLQEQKSIERSNKETWPVSPYPLSGFQPLVRSGAFDGISNEEVTSAIDDLLGRRLWNRERGRVLVTFPQQAAPWTVPASGWHIDVGSSHQKAVQLFVLVDDLERQGGGTLVLSGSHHLVKQYVTNTGLDPHPRAMKSVLCSASQWLAGLLGRHPESDEVDRIRRYMTEGEVINGVELCVVELHGCAGDVFIMDSDCFHTVASNNRETPRMMVTSMATFVGVDKRP